MITVTATYLKADGSPAAGRITLTPAIAAPYGVDPDIISNAKIDVELDEFGTFTADVIASDDLLWGTTASMPYHVTELILWAHPRRVYTVMLMTGAQSIREVIAFPKTQSAADVMTQAPGAVDNKALRDLHIRLREQPHHVLQLEAEQPHALAAEPRHPAPPLASRGWRWPCHRRSCCWR